MKAQDYISSNNLGEESDRNIVGILWYDERIKQIDKISISFELFDRSPEYGICGELNMAYNDMKTEIKDVLWRNYLQYLESGTDEQKEQIKYSLWVDFFEDSETVDEAWSKLVNNNSEIDVLRQVLSISGPVPFDKKNDLYLELIANKQNHIYILESLVGSFFDVFGQIDFQKAKILLPTLEVDKKTEKYVQLNENLEKFNSKSEYWDFVKTKDDNIR
jgi:hypothetical protein